MTAHEELHHLKRVLNRHRDALRATLIFHGQKMSDRVRRETVAEIGADKLADEHALCAFIRDVLQDEEDR